MGSSHKFRTILGLDLGPNSIGWAIIGQHDNSPDTLVDTGVRIFSAGLDGLEADGKGKSRNADRRAARGRRRHLERHTRRLIKLASALQRKGLLPDGDIADSHTRHNLFLQLDKDLGSPYQLRARALDEKLSEFELGRALYHMAQRRGFLSNRKSAPKDEKEEGEVKSAISELDRQMQAAGARTLGEYFAGLDPKQTRIRDCYTSRKMYDDEFKLIWEAQFKHYPQLLDEDFRKEVHRAIFHQRPLKSQKHLIGECELETGRKRAPWALLEAQRFRYIQTVNNLIIRNDGDTQERGLTEAEHATLLQALENDGDMTFPKIRKLLQLSKTSKFNLEEGGEKRIPGNRTAAKMRKIFGAEQWSEMSVCGREQAVEDVRSIVNDETLKKRALSHWALDEDSAKSMLKMRLDEGYCAFSRQAIHKLLPLLEKGLPLQTAIKERYPERWERKEATHNLLPPVDSDDMPTLRNPIVERTLTELRRVVNSLIARHGRPDFIRIELARELRQSAKQRGDTTKRMRAKEDERKAAAEVILKELEIEDPSPDDLLKFALAEECDWTCPYTGKSISMGALYGSHPQFDIEHIIPFSRCLDNSFTNKTLCCVTENRRVKGNKTPHEAYAGTEKWDDILTHVNGFKGNVAREKLRRFKLHGQELRDFINSFTDRQLNDTRWASRWAKMYLGLLYGGIDGDGIDASGVRRVQATSGPVTAYLRSEWQLNRILGDGPGKSRDDHRHHAVDAVVTALTEASAVKRLSDAAQRAPEARRRFFAPIDPPWKSFFDDVRLGIENVVVSHRVSKRVRGALHEETIYGKPYVADDGFEYVHLRRPLASLSARDLTNIADQRVRQCVVDKLEELGEPNPAKAFKDTANHPALTAGNGAQIPIHKVRVRLKLATFNVGDEKTPRHVQSDTNHHMELVAVTDDSGAVTKWEGHAVSMYEAYLRRKNGAPIVQRDFGENRRFAFSLANGEVIEIDSKDDPGTRVRCVIRSIESSGSGNIRWMLLSDARVESRLSRAGRSASPDVLRKLHCQKLFVTPVGDLRNAND
ncbi:MAG: type II CRISPR RNA-guided endonuclease Cas9 [Candidatus Zixiibacteriota bacterium]